MAKVPKVINQVLIVDGGELPQQLPVGFQKAIDSYKKLNPDYEHILFGEIDCKKYIKKNYNKRYLRLFNTLIPYAFKADLSLVLKDTQLANRMIASKIILDATIKKRSNLLFMIN